MGITHPTTQPPGREPTPAADSHTTTGGYTAMKPYNGHRSWNAWNVSLWIGNDEGIYNLAMFHTRHAKNKRRAAYAMLEDLPATTPDGAKYNFTCVLEALTGLE